MSEIREFLAEQYGKDLLFADGYDDCICGVIERYGMPCVVCYDIEKIISNIMSESFSREEAMEHFNYNILGSYVGEYTPCFLNKVYH